MILPRILPDKYSHSLLHSQRKKYFEKPIESLNVYVVLALILSEHGALALCFNNESITAKPGLI